MTSSERESLAQLLGLNVWGRVRAVSWRVKNLLVSVHRCFVDLTTLSRNVTHDFTLSLMNSENEEVKDGECTLHFNLCITGTRLKEDGETEKDKLVKGSGGYVRVLCVH